MSDFPDDPPTSPAAPLVTCPACHGARSFVWLAAPGVKERRLCGGCGGAGVVRLEAYERARRPTPTP